MLEEALEIATDADYKFDLAVQLGKLDVAKVLNILSLMFFFNVVEYILRFPICFISANYNLSNIYCKYSWLLLYRLSP